MATVIGARLGIEGFCHVPHCRAQSLQHLLDHGVFADQNSSERNLRRQVAVTDVPGRGAPIVRHPRQ